MNKATATSSSKTEFVFIFSNIFWNIINDFF